MMISVEIMIQPGVKERCSWPEHHLPLRTPLALLHRLSFSLFQYALLSCWSLVSCSTASDASSHLCWPFLMHTSQIRRCSRILLYWYALPILWYLDYTSSVFAKWMFFSVRKVHKVCEFFWLYCTLFKLCTTTEKRTLHSIVSAALCFRPSLQSCLSLCFFFYKETMK